jgi:molybdate transport system substrate-binding protein
MSMAGDRLHLLCAGAAQGLVKSLQARFMHEAGAQLQGRFGAVGVLKEALLAGEACDVMVATAAMIDALSAQGELQGTTRAPLGSVGTGIAVREGRALPRIGDAAALREALLAADALYFPDPLRATAGIHFADVLRRLGIHETLAPRFRTFPNGATSMRELAAAPSAHPIGCTQVTEISDTEGVHLVGPLPPGFGLTTVYCAAVADRAAQPALAQRFIALLCGTGSEALRRAGGFDPDG